MKIQAAVTHAQGEDFTIQEVTLSAPRSNEVLVKVVATGVCHTDAVARDQGISPYPIVLGHEGAGIVEQIGENVTSLNVGDHVVMSFAHCGLCENCLTGHPTVCSVFNELNFGGRMEDHTCRLHQGEAELATFFGQSSFGTHVVAHERNVVKEIKDAANGGTHYAVESTGVPVVVRQCLHALRPLGQAAIVGVTPEMNIDVHNDLMAEGKSMIGVIEGDSVPRLFIPKLIEFFKAGKFPFDKLVRFYNFDEINQAFEDSANGVAVKPILRLS